MGRHEGRNAPVLQDDARASGETLRTLARDGAAEGPSLRSSEGHEIAPWVVLLQALNHATDHRRQIAGMLRALGVTPPRVDGWGFGGSLGAVDPPL